MIFCIVDRKDKRQCCEMCFTLHEEIQGACSLMISCQLKYFRTLSNASHDFQFVESQPRRRFYAAFILPQRVGKILLGMELDRSRFVSILSFSRSLRAVQRQNREHANSNGGKTMMKRAEGKLQMNHKTTAGSKFTKKDVQRRHDQPCLFPREDCIFRIQGDEEEKGKARSRLREKERVKVEAEIEIILHFNV